MGNVIFYVLYLPTSILQFCYALMLAGGGYWAYKQRDATVTLWASMFCAVFFLVGGILGCIKGSPTVLMVGFIMGLVGTTLLGPLFYYRHTQAIKEQVDSKPAIVGGLASFLVWCFCLASTITVAIVG